MRVKLYQVDAFAARAFEGNPAAVCPLERWPDDRTLQAIAAENNLSETAFFVPDNGADFVLRWFTPLREIDLCGHATLAAAHVLFEIHGHPGPNVTFATRSGRLSVCRRGAQLEMDFPARPLAPCPAPSTLIAGLGREPVATLVADDYVAVFAEEATIRALPISRRWRSSTVAGWLLRRRARRRISSAGSLRPQSASRRIR